MDTLFDQLQQHMREVMPELPRPVFVVDGATLRTPASPELAEQFPPGRNQHGDNHWPTMSVVVFHDAYTGLATRPAWGAMYGPQAVSEQQLATEALDRLPAGAVVIADGNFGIFAFAHAVAETHRPMLFRLTRARAGKTLESAPLRPGRRRKTLWRPSYWDRRSHPELGEQCAVQGWVVACRNPCRPDEVLYFFTTLDLKPARILALYKLRWNIETDLRSLKSAATTEGARRRELERLLDAVDRTRLPHRIRKKSYPRQIWGRGGQFPSRTAKTRLESCS